MIDDRDEKPVCWKCGSTNVHVAFREYRRAYCLRGCMEEHVHHEDVPAHDLRCRGCGHAWVDGSGDFAEMVRS
jgi:hypothetical protein